MAGDSMLIIQGIQDPHEICLPPLYLPLELPFQRSENVSVPSGV